MRHRKFSFEYEIGIVLCDHFDDRIMPYTLIDVDDHKGSDFFIQCVNNFWIEFQEK